jgi:hypothetical protein
MLTTERGADCRVPGAQPLRGGDYVRDEWEVVRREPAARAAEPGDDLVEADQEPVVLTTLGQALPEKVRWLVGGERSRADRLAEERRDCLWAGFFQDTVESRERRLTGRVEALGRRWDVEECRWEVRRERAV